MDILIESKGRPGLTRIWVIDSEGNKISELTNVTEIIIDPINNNNPKLTAKLTVKNIKLNVKTEVK